MPALLLTHHSRPQPGSPLTLALLSLMPIIALPTQKAIVARLRRLRSIRFKLLRKATRHTLLAPQVIRINTHRPIVVKWREWVGHEGAVDREMVKLVAPLRSVARGGGRTFRIGGVILQSPQCLQTWFRGVPQLDIARMMQPAPHMTTQAVD